MYMSSSNPGYEFGDDEILFYPPLPPHLESPSTSFFGVFPQNIGYNTQQDVSLLFHDDYTQNSPNQVLKNSCITHQAIELGQGGPNENGEQQGDQRAVQSMMIKKKKMDHNEKERVRRLHLNKAYLALRSLLPPDSHKPKKKWSAPYLIDRAVDHIPKLEGDVAKLKSKKKDLLYELQKVDNLKRVEEAKKQEKLLSVSINEVKKGEVIIQICHPRNKVAGISSELLNKLEREGMEILAVSVLDPCEDRSCYHIHLQMTEISSLGADYVADLKEKLVVWLI